MAGVHGNPCNCSVRTLNKPKDAIRKKLGGRLAQYSQGSQDNLVAMSLVFSCRRRVALVGQVVPQVCQEITGRNCFNFAGSSSAIHWRWASTSLSRDDTFFILVMKALGLLCLQDMKNIECELIKSRYEFRRKLEDERTSKSSRGIDWSNIQGKRARTEPATADMVGTIEKCSKREKKFHRALWSAKSCKPSRKRGGGAHRNFTYSDAGQ
ncbi:hypothetical protein B0H13DRAFT_1853376 [Mycena leptocephala]|nr:hypothetical protein B0H13DRAFT_1853376 [Mycena leptocephala]